MEVGEKASESNYDASSASLSHLAFNPRSLSNSYTLTLLPNMSEAPNNPAQQPAKDESSPNEASTSKVAEDVEMKSEPVKEEEPPLPDDVLNATPEE